jgi:hypothetical protein
LALTPPIPVPRESPGGDEVVTVPVVVDDDRVDEAGHDVGELHFWSDPKIVNLAEGAGLELNPGLFVAAVRVYPMPCWLIFRSENEATPALAFSVVVPDSVPEPGFTPRATVTATDPIAAWFVMGWPDPSRTATLTGPPDEPKPDLITAGLAGVLAAVPAGCPSFVNASEHVPASVPWRFPALAGSGWKLLPGRPLKSFDCLTSIPH